FLGLAIAGSIVLPPHTPKDYHRIKEVNAYDHQNGYRNGSKGKDGGGRTHLEAGMRAGHDSTARLRERRVSAQSRQPVRVHLTAKLAGSKSDRRLSRRPRPSEHSETHPRSDGRFQGRDKEL